MGTKVQCKSFLPRGYPMRDLNDDSNTCGRSSLYYEEKALTDSRFYDGFFPNLTNAYLGYDKDSVKQKMLEHEAIFKTQVCELHRLYRVQRDMMNGLLQRKEHRRNRNHLGSQSGLRLEDAEVSELRPSKVHRKTFDLQLPANEYIDTGNGDRLRNGVKLCCDMKSVEDRSSSFADLNEPARVGHVQETKASSPYKFCNGKICDSDRSIKKPSFSQVLSFPKEISLNSYRREADAQSDSHMHGNGIGNEWLSCVPEVGQRKSHPQFPLSMKQTQVSTSKVHQNTSYRKEETVFGEEISVRPRDLTSDIKVTSLAISSPESAKPWLYTLEKPSSTFSHKPLSAQTYGAPNWFLGSNAVSKPAFANGFFKGSKEQPIRSSSNDRDPGHWTSMALNRIDMNLNEVVSECLSAREMPVSGLERKSDEDCQSVFPWLRPPKLVYKNGALECEPIPKSCEISFSQSPLSPSPNSTIDKSKDCDLNSNPSDIQSSNNKRLLGFPIFENPRASEKNQAVVLDMNLPCEQIKEEIAVITKVTDVDSGISFRRQIDLNSCLSDGEEDKDDSLKPSSAPTAREKFVTEIDLEAPPISEPEEEQEKEEEESSSSKPNEEEEEKSVAGAAEAIVVISASVSLRTTNEKPRQKPADPLAWLAEIVSSLDDDDVASGSESDFFEAMTLKLAETNEAAEIPGPGPGEEAGQGRKGSSGRRRRRDFQRDILPGLASLSRHEVTEDLQLFGGLMRATGQPGPARRGRRRATVSPPALPEPPPLVETGLEDRSLTGWGKITRRPRRQRCPSGNLTLFVKN